MSAILAWAGWILGTIVSGAALFVAHRARRRLVGALKQTDASEELFSELTKAATDWIWETDDALCLVAVSDGFLRCTGEDPSTLEGELLHGSSRIVMDDDVRRTIAVSLAAQRPFRDVSCRVPAGDGGWHHFKISGSPSFDENGRLKGYRGAGVDIGDLIEAKDRAQFLDRHDALTGLSNRIGMIEELSPMVCRAREHDPLMVVVDIARFGSINDAYGAAAGDRVLGQLAERLHACLRPDDSLFRLGNDEFLLVRPAETKFETSDELLLNLTDTLDEPFEIDGERVRIGTHIGVYTLEPDVRDVETGVRRALIALRHGKSMGDRIAAYADGMDVEAEMNRRLEEDLRTSIRSDGLVLNYQPQLSLKQGRIVGAEALVRWHHRAHGFVSPARFIPLAERTGVISELSRWAVRRACLDAARWPNLTVSVNLSPIDVRQDDFLDWIENATEGTGTPRERIELEITESVLFDDTEAGLDKLRALRRMGFKIALDDFGTGYAGLGYLQMFPFDKLKIDQSFVKRMTRSKHGMAIVQSVIKLGHELDLTVCAEGVEDEAQLEALLMARCDLIQGYYTGAPVPALRMDALTKRQADRRSPRAGRRNSEKAPT